MAEAAETYMRTTVKDPKLQQALIPDYPVGGKRILISDDYYATLNRDNVELVTAGIDHLEEHAVVTEDGRTIPVDVLIYATGFESTAFLAPMAIHGRGGKLLQDEWSGGARAYLGISVAEFPNLFLMYGPNTNLGHNSIIFMIECQANYILSCLRLMNESSLRPSTCGATLWRLSTPPSKKNYSRESGRPPVRVGTRTKPGALPTTGRAAP